MGLDLYSKVEPYLEFDEEIVHLHKEFLNYIFEHDCDNIIDIGCGQGYLLENLAINSKKGFGIDLSAKQIEVCEHKGLNAQCIALEDVKEKFDTATAIFDVLNYIPTAEVKEFLNAANLVLNQGGIFIFDVNSLFGFEEVAEGSINIDVDDKFIAIDAIFENEKLTTDITLFSKNSEGLYAKEHDSIVQQYHSKSFLSKTLTECNFEILELREFKLHSFDVPDKLIFICKKK